MQILWLIREPLNKSRRESLNKVGGFTLFETIVVVFLLASVATISSIAFQPAFGSAKLEYASSLLRSDLKNARRHARANGIAVEIEFGENQYSITALEITRLLDKGLSLNVAAAERFYFTPDGLSQGATIQLHGRKRTSILSIEPLTGRIRQHD